MTNLSLKVKRDPSTSKATSGKLYLNGVFECYTLEDVERPVKVYGETAIPKGVYTVKITYSPKYKRLMPLICGVPGFEGIRIHSGNTSEDTLGCLLVGQTRGVDSIGLSRAAYAKLFAKLQAADSITLTIE